ncbi:hypothetical protein CSUI_007433 [Cystoisospora suis]|uniref:Uncharacterized protein n=1 Tax=Cystoisospora suis TaxID=483139 RepID=A0A2C6KQY4_9APIC|nr:hypothetical protein CSUI_007433 [Cystoisospora suis]
MNFLQLVDVTEYQSECWKGDVFEFDMCGDSALPYCVFVCNVYSDISGTREAFPECTQVCVAARLPVDTMNASEVAESQCFLMTRLEQLREAFHPYVALRSRHYLPVAAAVGVPATSQTV